MHILAKMQKQIVEPGLGNLKWI